VGKSQRTKGIGYEREIARRFRDVFPQAARNLTETQAGGQGVDLVNTGRLRIQCKRGRQYAPCVRIEEVSAGDGLPVLVTKADRRPDLVVMRLCDFLAMLEDVGIVFEE